ncbi:MAG: type-F conjugative transfer system pilin assembly protein TrbC [Alphaproteobacteria bacterium]|nr:type-F conjugative transfer system pilin assembly protein TrbC [Alphaproteobacteria bacterium]
MRFEFIDFIYFISLLGLPVTASCQSYISEIHDLQKESFKKIERLHQDESFQHFVTKLQDRALAPHAQHAQSQRSNELYIFVSFSIGEKALLNLAQEAKRFGATLVLRGFKDRSYFKTAQALQQIIQETGQGFMIDPELFSLFAVTAVPTYVLSKPFPFNFPEVTQTPLHDRLQGYVSVFYALSAFAKEGSLKKEANSLLENASLENGRSK